MSLELINGAASEGANGDHGSFFSGTVSPRWFNVDESLQQRAGAFLQESFAGRHAARELREAFSTSDFTLAAFAQIDSEAQAQYAELPSVWRQYTSVTSVSDFRPKRLFDRWQNQLGLKLVPELTEYPTGQGGDFATSWINVAKYGLRDAISFEAMINNDAIDELEAIPSKFARAANETETINALANLLAVDPATNLANGFNTSFWKSYTSGQYNGVNNTPDTKALTAANLDAALQSMASRVSKRGRLIYQPDLVLVVPKALEHTMNKIKSLREIRETDAATNTESIYDNFLTTANYVVEPMLDTINTHAKARTSWMILPVPSAPRPASFAAFLRGYETPDMRVKADQGNSLGGGAITPREGSFEIDDIQYRVRHILGHQNGDPTFTYASYGA